jgi:hypothetical protein
MHIRPLLKLAAAAAILAAALNAPAAQASTCTNTCYYDYNQCLTVWGYPQSECDLDLRYCLRRC